MFASTHGKQFWSERNALAVMSCQSEHAMAINDDEPRTVKLQQLGLMTDRKLMNYGRLKSSSDDDKLEHY